MKTPKNKLKSSDDLKHQDKAVDIADESKAVKKKPKVKKQKATKDAVKNAAVAEAKESSKTLTPADIAKIEKKKAKKLAQKLKKKENKLANKTDEETTQQKPKVEPKSNIKEKTPAAVKEAKADHKDKKQKARPKRHANDKDEDAVKRERDPAAEAATIFVGNLPVNTKRIQLVRLVQPFGTVSYIRLRTAGGKQLMKHKQRKAAGSLNAYIVFQTPEMAQKALTLNGTEFKENHLRVTPAAKAGPSANDQSTSNDADNKRTIFVGNLKYSANEGKLREIFSSCGDIDYIRCLQDGEKGCKGVAYVCFQKPDAVGLALELNETMLDERPIHVERYAVKKLGAKQARDSATAASGKGAPSKKKLNSTGAKKRIDKKQRKENGKPAEPAKSATKKKSEFRGVKVDAIKKEKKQKKKTNNEMNALAKKIAPKPKTT